ncbi:MAG: isoleucine--tRNA ligase [bacterium]|nr:isoleucine--tRNA ligase [bacterium]
METPSQREERILKLWEKIGAFKKSIEQRPADKPYVFYDGPPFATGLPHYGHIVASVMKDMVPRFWTMKGYRVNRRWGWDCHGLPVENIIEEELKLGSKKDIEGFGVDRFNEACRARVLTYTEEWKKTINRLGRWVDMEHAYKTMDPEFMESVWWVFKALWDKGLIYQGYKSMHVCPRCETPLSNFEVTLGYKDVDDISATVKFKVKNPSSFGIQDDLFILAWTTTPWTLPGNVLLAVGPDNAYVFVSYEGSTYSVAKERVADVFKDKEYEVLKEVKGSELVGIEYEPVFPYFTHIENAFRVVQADFVTTEDGTGVVHIAPAFGEEDYHVGIQEGIPLVQHVTMSGRMSADVTDFANKEVKPKEAPSSTDIEVIKWLAAHDALFSKKKIKHSYPHCWRCDTPLLNYLTSSWFIKVTAIKEEMVMNNTLINWVPDHIKEGRFGKWLEGSRDWAVSRNRFWGTPLPIWQSEDGNNTLCVGSISELEQLSGVKVTDLHTHNIDGIEFEKNGKRYHRVPEVLDCWFESGSMPYAERHYPFEGKELFEKEFPAEFIAEGQDQTRGWFYTLMVLSTALFGTRPFKNVIVNGLVLAESGKKMSKRLKNYPDPWDVFEKYGADALRYYLMSSPVVHAENLNFEEKGVRETLQKVVMIIANVVSFYEMYAEKDLLEKKNKPAEHILDQWILSKLYSTLHMVTERMENYDLIGATRPIGVFIHELSTWYIRRSRERLKGDEKEDKAACVQTLHEVLLVLSKMMAPVMPFIAEHIFQTLKQYDSGISEESVHLTDWPQENLVLIRVEIEKSMEQARLVVEMTHALRAECGIKVRQPLSEMVTNQEVESQLSTLIADEVNIHTVSSQEILPTGEGWLLRQNGEVAIAVLCEITPALKEEGIVREFVRSVNAYRKEMGLTIRDSVTLTYDTDNEELDTIISKHSNEFRKTVLTSSVKKDALMEGHEITLDSIRLRIQLVKSQ